MKTFFKCLMLGLFCLLIVPGCGDSGTKSVVEGASKSDIQKYEEMVAADAAAMSASQASDASGTAPTGDAPKAE
jgi:hypothetical protein